jgi:Cu+-exporting ATPase
MTDAPRTTGTDTLPPLPIGTIDLAIGGMTCASCVARVEKKLNKVPGAQALVNLVTEAARVTVTAEVEPAALIAAVESAGYTARVTRRDLPADAAHSGTGSAGAADSPGTVTKDAPSAGTTTVVGLASGREGAAGTSSTAEGSSVDTDTSAPAPDRGADLRRRLIVAAVLAVPVTALSMIPALQFRGWQWLVAALAMPVATWCAMPFHRAAWRAGKHGASTMDTLVSIGIIAATTWSLWALLLGGAGELGMQMHPALFPRRAAMGGGVPELYFEVAAVVTTFLLAGRYAEHRSRRRAGDALRALLTLGAKEVALLTTGPDGREVENRVPIGQLGVGDLFAVRPGEKVATDGVVVRGTSAIDTSLLTGEPVPVDVRPGSDVTGATLNTSGHLVVRATRIGEQTMLAQIGRLVITAQTGKAPVQRLADRISAVFVPIVLALSVATLVTWLMLGNGPQAAFTAAVAVLIIACPCALGLATPTALLVGSGRGAQLGILIKGPQILESTRRVDTIVLDKTGTVTEGRMQVVDVFAADDASVAEVLRYAGAVESRSEHPIAQAVAAAAVAAAATAAGSAAAAATPTALDAADPADAAESARVGAVGVGGAGVGADGVGIGSDEVTEFANEPGRGVVGVVRIAHAGLGMARRVLVGRPSWLAEQGVSLSDPDDADSPGAELAAAFRAAETSGATAVMAAWNGKVRGVIVLRDPAKPTSAEAVRELRALGLRPMLLTGDNRGAAVVAARAVGIDADDVIAEVLPADKVDALSALQKSGAIVAMVGDGVNDAAALAQANLGLAMGTGTDAAIEAADITLVRGDLRSAAQAIRLSRHTLRIIKQNLFWAFSYNVAAIPLAALGLLNPMIAGAAMAFSSVLVVSNSLRLRRFA